MGRRIIAIFAAAVVALIGVTSVLLYARSADARAVQANQPVDAYVAAKVVPAGTTLKDAVRTGLLEKTTAAAKGLPAGALTRVTDSNSSLLAMTDIQPGEFVMSARFGTTPTGNKAIQVPAGMVAVSVQLSDPARVGTFVTPGTHLAIFDSYKIKAIGTDEKSKAINDADIQSTSRAARGRPRHRDGTDRAHAWQRLARRRRRARQEGHGSRRGASFLVTVAVTPRTRPA